MSRTEQHRVERIYLCLGPSSTGSSVWEPWERSLPPGGLRQGHTLSPGNQFTQFWSTHKRFLVLKPLKRGGGPRPQKNYFFNLLIKLTEINPEIFEQLRTMQVSPFWSRGLYWLLYLFRPLILLAVGKYCVHTFVFLMWRGFF